MSRSLLSLLLLPPLLTACGKEVATDSGAAGPGSGPFANSLPEEDPDKAGEALFLTSTWGAEVAGDWPPAEFMLELMADPGFGPQFAEFGFLADPDDDFPVGFKRGSADPDAVFETCALCHTGALPDGRVWLGAPNNALRWGDFQIAVDAAWTAAGNDPLLTDLEREKKALLGPGRTSAEGSSYEQVIPADFPVYFDLGERTALNYMGTGQDARTEIHFALFAFGCSNPTPEEAQVPWPEEAEVEALVAYMSGIAAPEAPEQDAALVARGEEVFAEAACDSCHHPGDLGEDGVVTVDPDWEGGELLPGEHADYPRGLVATSPLHRTLQDDDSGTGASTADFIAFIVAHGLSVMPTDGYRVGPLLGLWASAPYLHNGSVPSLDDLLLPASERPESFERAGWTVDTRLDGNSNAGHEFGTELSAEDREALVAWLLSL